MKTLCAAVCVALALGATVAAPRRARSVGYAHAHGYDAHHYDTHHYDAHHYGGGGHHYDYAVPQHEYYTVATLPAQYSLGARHVATTSKTRFHVQVPVTYSYTLESAPATSVVSYHPAHAHHYDTHSHYDHAAVYAPAKAWQWEASW